MTHKYELSPSCDEPMQQQHQHQALQPTRAAAPAAPGVLTTYLVEPLLRLVLVVIHLCMAQFELHSRYVRYQYHRVISLRREHYRQKVRELRNIPTNVAIGINHHNLPLDRLAELIQWCRLVPTIKTVTIYCPYLESKDGGGGGTPIELNSLLPSHVTEGLAVTVLSSTAGRRSMISAARHFATTQCGDESQTETAPTSSPPVTIESISEYLKRDYPYADPELLLLFGDSRIFNAFPCWQIRLTETMFFPPLEWITLSQFYQALLVYSKCEQRFGK